MGGFFASLFSEIPARRRRMRGFFGDRAQALTEFLIMGGVVVGSLGLFVRPWMPAAAPWGFALPFVFLVGHLLIEWRRQAAAASRSAGEGEDESHRRLDCVPVVVGLRGGGRGGVRHRLGRAARAGRGRNLDPADGRGELGHRTRGMIPRLHNKC